MTINDVAALDVHRGRRTQRLREGLALHAADPKRRAVSECLAAIVTVVGADRVAAAYVDDFDAGPLQIYCILDLLSEQPRRLFDIGLHTKGAGGVPDYWDEVESPRRGPGSRSNALTCAIGSDGSRSWFIVADSRTRRFPLSEVARDDLLFFAGKCAAVLLHADLSHARQQGQVAGWPLLQDLSGREDDEDASRRIASRFVIVRGLQVAAEGAGAVQRVAQAEVCRAELEALPPEDAEHQAWERGLQGLEVGDMAAMAAAALDMGSESERRLEFGSAETCFHLAYDLATGAASLGLATDATRFRGRVLRRQGRWLEAEDQYQRARGLALAACDHERHGLVLSGLAAVARSRGNLPRTRELLMVQLEIGEREGSVSVLAAAHHDLMALNKITGDLEGALAHGWEAVRHLGEREGMLQALTDLASVLTELGAHEAAEDAYSIVAARIEHNVYRIYALGGLAYLSALAGNAEEFALRSARLDEEGFACLPEAMQAELLYERGLAYRALGDQVAAVRWLTRARDRSEAWGVNKILFDVEAVLEEMRTGANPPTPGRSGASREALNSAARCIGDGLRDLREQLVGV